MNTWIHSLTPKLLGAKMRQIYEYFKPPNSVNVVRQTERGDENCRTFDYLSLINEIPKYYPKPKTLHAIIKKW